MESGGIVLLIGLVALYFLPSFVAAGRDGAGGPIVLNLFLGWTLLGWVVALAWAASLKPSQHADAKRQCPHCAESIRTEAVMCRFCQREVEPVEREKTSGEVWRGE